MSTSPISQPTAAPKRRRSPELEVIELHKPDAEACKRALRMILNAPEPREKGEAA